QSSRPFGEPRGEAVFSELMKDFFKLLKYVRQARTKLCNIAHLPTFLGVSLYECFLMSGIEHSANIHSSSIRTFHEKQKRPPL
ncbi:MAG TPA: hypothetical protein VHA06_07330, partial [Candidatus Angelobacter sp.]|nr:hypothetical protein [Candidatus Angelobacter sp.]